MHEYECNALCALELVVHKVERREVRIRDK